jgi:hypothetical protein
MDVLEIEVNGQFLELYEDEKIVQSLNVLNINDITKRGSEYTNAFKVPRTNVNSNIIEFADFVTSNSSFPFVKNECSIYINGYQFKKGYLQLIEVAKDLTLRFYTGNIGFYNKLKAAKLNQIQLTDLDHTWSLTNAVASRLNNEGYIYPLIDYNGVLTTGNSIDVRRLLPAYFDKTLMSAVCSENGYTLINNITGSTLTEYESGILPTTKKNPVLPQDILDANKYIGGITPLEAGVYSGQIIVYQNNSFGYYLGTNVIHFPDSNAMLGSNNNLYNNSIWNNGQYGTGVFTAQYAGNYKITTDFEYIYNLVEQWSSAPFKTTTVYLYIEIEVNGVIVQNIASNTFSTTQTFPTNYDITGVVNQQNTIYLNTGDQMRIVFNASHFTSVGSFIGPINFSAYSYLYLQQYPNLFSALKVELQTELTYGSELKAQYLLAEMSQADYFKDTCLRYCLIPTVNEDTKEVSLNLFNTIQNNISNAVDWSSLVDETDEPAITYELSDYAQANNIKHKADKSILIDVIGSDYVIRLNNENLLPEKTLYTSPFAASEDVVRLETNKMIFIDLHDGTTFKKDVQPRRCYIEKVNVSINYTDGTNTTNVTTSIPLTWFIRADKNYNMGFGNNQMSRYSNDLISILQGLRIIKIDIRLSLIDILNLNYFYPIYLSQYNAYFFVSNINQFDYTSNDATKVELIKLT